MLMSDSRQSRLTWQETKVSTARWHDTTVLHTAPRWRFWASPGPQWSWSDSGGRLSRDDRPPACGSHPGSAWSAAMRGDGEHLDRNSWPTWIHPQDEEACEHITHTQLTSLNRVAKVYPSQEPKKNIKKINNWQPQQQCASWVHLRSMEPPCALLHSIALFEQAKVSEKWIAMCLKNLIKFFRPLQFFCFCMFV